ncbi:hypothetical protein YPPY14_0990, partial [Yersinia pestis PY-14]
MISLKLANEKIFITIKWLVQGAKK